MKGQADMAELADAPDLGSGGQPRAGSSPVIRIRRALIIGVLFLLHCIWCCSVRTRWERDLLKKIGVFALGIALVWMITPVLSLASDKDTEKSTETVIDDVYSEDDRLKLIHHETYAYDKTSATIEDGIYKQYMWVIKNYDKEEIEKSSHAYFDEQNRLLYALGYSANILSGKNNYCEENIYQRNNTEHTCRYIYYKSNSAPYRDGYYIAYRYMFEASDFQFDEQDRLLLHLSYRRNVGSDPNGYSEELFFSEGYQAEYDKERLMAEWCYRDYWGTNEVGVWEYRIYQYNKQGDCSLKVVVTEEEILLLHYKYLKESGQAEVYAYQVTEDFEISCEDGSTYYLRPQWGKPALQKVAADGSIEKELFYGKAIDMGQQHYLMPKEVEETLDDHIYTVNPGDCLWNIAKQHYGYGSYYTLLYRMNRGTIGDDNYLLLPGMRLYIPEVGNAQDTKVTD